MGPRVKYDSPVKRIVLEVLIIIVEFTTEHYFALQLPGTMRRVGE